MATLPKTAPRAPKTQPPAGRAHSLGVVLPKVTTKHRGPIAAAKAKTHLLALINQVNLDRTPIVITRRGRPVAQLVPVEEKAQPDIFGCMKGTGRITGDIVGPEPDVWEAMSE